MGGGETYRLLNSSVQNLTKGERLFCALISGAARHPQSPPRPAQARGPLGDFLQPPTLLTTVVDDHLPSRNQELSEGGAGA